MRVLSSALAVLGSVIPAALLGLVLLVVTADVVARLFLATSIHFAHDIAIIALAGVVWFGIVGTAQSGELFGIRFFTDRLSEKLRGWTDRLVHVLTIVIAFEVLRAAMIQVETARFTRFVSLGWPKWIVSAGLAGAMAALIVVELIRLGQTLKSHWGGRAE